MKKLTGITIILFLAGSLAAATETGLEIGVSPLLLWPFGPAASEIEQHSLFDPSVGGKILLGYSMHDWWVLVGGMAILPLALHNVSPDGNDLLYSATLGLGLRMPLFGHSRLSIGGDVGVYRLYYDDRYYSPSLCLDVEARVERNVGDWIALFGSTGYSCYFVDITPEALLHGAHFSAGVSIGLCRR